MISAKSNLAVALGVAGALVLSAAAAEAAQTARKKQVNRDAVVNSQNYQPGVGVPNFGRSFNYVAPNYGYSGGGINFNDGRNGANYHPQQ